MESLAPVCAGTARGCPPPLESQSDCGVPCMWGERPAMATAPATDPGQRFHTGKLMMKSSNCFLWGSSTTPHLIAESLRGWCATVSPKTNEWECPHPCRVRRRGRSSNNQASPVLTNKPKRTNKGRQVLGGHKIEAKKWVQ